MNYDEKNFKEKYLKYKIKYNELRQVGGSDIISTLESGIHELIVGIPTITPDISDDKMIKKINRLYDDIYNVEKSKNPKTDKPTPYTKLSGEKSWKKHLDEAYKKKVELHDRKNQLFTIGNNIDSNLFSSYFGDITYAVADGKKDNLSLLTDDWKIDGTITGKAKIQNSVGTLMNVQYPINDYSNHYAVNRCNISHLYKLIKQFYDLSKFNCKTKYTISVVKSFLKGKTGTGTTTIKLINVEYIDFKIKDYRVENIKLITLEEIAAAKAKAAAEAKAEAAAEAEAKAAAEAEAKAAETEEIAAKAETEAIAAQTKAKAARTAAKTAAEATAAEEAEAKAAEAAEAATAARAAAQAAAARVEAAAAAAARAAEAEAEAEAEAAAAARAAAQAAAARAEAAAARAEAAAAAAAAARAAAQAAAARAAAPAAAPAPAPTQGAIVENAAAPGATAPAAAPAAALAAASGAARAAAPVVKMAATAVGGPAAAAAAGLAQEAVGKATAANLAQAPGPGSNR